jgi:hypothetical protein
MPEIVLRRSRLFRRTGMGMAGCGICIVAGAKTKDVKTGGGDERGTVACIKSGVCGT